MAEHPWFLGGTNPKKVIHRPTCPSARFAYPWADAFPDVNDLARALVANRAEDWHHACNRCSFDLWMAIVSACVNRNSAAAVAVGDATP